jgi:hypothetical protein
MPSCRKCRPLFIGAVSNASAQVAQKRWQVEKKIALAPTAGEITETDYRPGEWVPAGQAVVSLLPDDQRRIRFFVPETLIDGIHLGSKVEATCDGYASPIQAQVSFIAAQAEYTPPVIYSRGSREKLRFRVEAMPAPEQAARLRPGLPVDIDAFAYSHLEFVCRCDADMAQKGAGQFREGALNEIQPRAMLGRINTTDQAVHCFHLVRHLPFCAYRNRDSTVITRHGEQEGVTRGYNSDKRGRPSHHPPYRTTWSRCLKTEIRLADAVL